MDSLRISVTGCGESGLFVQAKASAIVDVVYCLESQPIQSFVGIKMFISHKFKIKKTCAIPPSPLLTGTLPLSIFSLLSPSSFKIFFLTAVFFNLVMGFASSRLEPSRICKTRCNRCHCPHCWMFCRSFPSRLLHKSGQPWTICTDHNHPNPWWI